jgi:phosphatidylglycerophosphate synthase
LEQQSIFYELLKELKDARFRPSAVIGFTQKGLQHAVGMTKVLTQLRRSFYFKFSSMLVVIIAIALLFYHLISPDRFFLLLGIESCLIIITFIITILQLHLVRSEQSGAIYQKFVFPNVLTLMRLLFLPFIAGGLLFSEPESSLSKITLFILVFSAISDIIDGLLSRWFRMSSDFGRIYDPIVDYAFQTTMSIVTFIAGLVPWWLLSLILLRYWLPVIIGTGIYLTLGPIRIKSTWMGKVSSFTVYFYMCGIVCLRAFRVEWMNIAIHPFVEYATGIILGLASLGFVIWEVSIKRKTFCESK